MLQHKQHTLTSKTLSLATTLNDVFYRRKSGHALPECYGDKRGAKIWESFVKTSDPEIQYTFQSEVNTIDSNLNEITSIINNDIDLNKNKLLVIEKGSGSVEAIEAKSLKVLKALIKSGMEIDLYSPWDCSEKYRHEAYTIASIYGINTEPLNVDFNEDDPNIATNRISDVERPRIVMEFGSSRGNIPTSEYSIFPFAEQTYAELQRRFRLDRKNCREGGVLILGTDANNTESAREAYLQKYNGMFSENILYRGVDAGIFSDNFKPELFKYSAIWDKENYVVKHTLIAKESQSFDVLNESGEFKRVEVKRGEGFVLNHSIKWPIDKIISAAESQGFKCLKVCYGEDRRIPVYIFKAVPIEPVLKVVE